MINKFSLGLALVLTLCLGSVAMASGHKTKVYGAIEKIDATKQTFTVKTSEGKTVDFFTDPKSEYEVEFRDHTKRDLDIPFTDLKIGDQVKVKAYRGPDPLLVDEVEVYR